MILNDPTVMSAFQATIGGRFASLSTLVDEDADLDSMVTHFNKVVTDAAAELLGKQRRKVKPVYQQMTLSPKLGVVEISIL